MCKVRLLLLSALLLCFSIGAQADNSVTISSTEGAPDQEVTVSIAVQNSDALSSLQVSIPLDENLTLVEGSGQVGSRCSSHSLTVGVKDGVLNVFVYSLSMAAISDNSGEVASFKLKLGNVPQTVNLTPSKLVLTNSVGTEVSGTSTAGEVTTRCAKAQYSTMEVDYGEVPIHSIYQQTVTVSNTGNEDLTITGLTFSDVNVFSSTTTLPLIVPAGQSESLNVTYAPEERGTVSRTLKVECNSVSKLNTIALRAQPFAVNELHVQPASGVSDEEVTVHMTMNNMDAISGYQVEFTLPSQYEYVANSFELSSRKQDHQAIAVMNGNVLRIIVYSSSDTPLTGNDGEIGSFRLKLVGRYGTTLTPSKTVLSATINSQVENVMSDVYGGYITIQSPQISCNNSFNMGAVSVTESCEKAYTIRNYGSGPLTISKVVFDNEHMSIKESLPLVIPVSGNSNITVVYDSEEQADFASTMQIYSNDPELRMKSVAVSGNIFAPNYLTIATGKVFAGENLKIDVSTDNYDPLTGVQFDVEYPGQYFESFSGNVALTDRATGMTVSSHQIDDNTLRFFCYFLTGGSIAAGSGKLMTIQLKPKEVDIPEGSHNVTLKEIKLGTSDMDNKYSGPATYQTSFDTIDAIRGDVNDDGLVTAQDASLVLQAVAGKIVLSPSQISIADVNGDTSITAQDASLILQKVAGKIDF